MASREPEAIRTAEVRPDAGSETLSPATPGAETLGSPDAQSDTQPSAQSDVVDDSASTDDTVLAPATPGADTLGVDE